MYFSLNVFIHYDNNNNKKTIRHLQMFTTRPTWLKLESTGNGAINYSIDGWMDEWMDK